MERPPPFRSLCIMRTREGVAQTTTAAKPGSPAAAIAPRARDRRLALIIPGAAVLVTGTLLLLHRPAAEVLVDTEASQVAFTVTQSYAPLRGISQVSSVVLPGLARVRQEGVPEVVAEPDESLVMRIEPDAASKMPGSIGFDFLLVPAGTQIEMVRTDSSTVAWRFQYPSGTSPSIDVDGIGALVVRLKGLHRLSFAAPARITAIPAGDAQVIVEFRSHDLTFPARVSVSSISWNRDMQLSDPLSRRVLVESSILSGELSLEEFKDRLVTLRNGERLHLDGASGLIRQLHLDPEALSCQFDGSAKGISIGEGNRKHNLMPTWLEWFRQWDALHQFWAVAVFLTGFGLTVAQWWRGSK